jgi:hypothetical protein
MLQVLPVISHVRVVDAGAVMYKLDQVQDGSAGCVVIPTHTACQIVLVYRACLVVSSGAVAVRTLTTKGTSLQSQSNTSRHMLCMMSDTC